MSVRIRAVTLLASATFLAACDGGGDGGSGSSAPPLVCDDADPCTVDSADGSGGCRYIHVSRCTVPAAATVLPLPSGSSCVASSCAIPDTDGDGLNDAWETQGGIDVDCDGAVVAGTDVLLPGADVEWLDVYLEYDVMEQTGQDAHSHAPSAAAIQAVVEAFARRGVNLHVDPVHDVLAHRKVVTFAAVDPACAGNDAVNFHDLKRAHSVAARRLAYHYAVFGHYHTCGSLAECANCPPESGTPPVFGATGRAELPGNDLALTTGAFFDAALVPTFEQEAGLLMHELGHNFGLKHGGATDLPDFKPNYLGAVNSNFTFTGIPFAAAAGSVVAKPCAAAADCAPGGVCTSAGTCARIDYSGQALAALDETSLDEALGIQAGGTDITTFNCPDTSPVQGPADGPIDWNCTPPGTESPVSADVNGDGAMDVLEGFDDWSAIRYVFQCTVAGSADGPAPAGRPPAAGATYSVEPSFEQLRRRQVLFAPLRARVEARPGVLRATTLLLHGSPRLAAAEVELSSLRLDGRPPRTLAAADLDQDGFEDLLLEFPAADRPGRPPGAGTLTGRLRSSQRFAGEVPGP